MRIKVWLIAKALCRHKSKMVQLTECPYASHTDKAGKTTPVKSFTWENSNKVSVQVITYGAIITSIKTPDKNGVIKDITTGFSGLEGYQKPDNPYFGATVGRVANRIACGQFKLFNETITVTKNYGQHQLHGGFVGFNNVNWESFVSGNKVVMSYHSPDLEEGFPGDLVVHASFELTERNELLMEMKATTTKPTIVSMLQHAYLNLAGHNAGANELYKHVITINSHQITEVDKEIPTGRLLPVGDTVFDFRIPKILGEVIHKVPDSNGFDHNFCITKDKNQGMAYAARACHPESGRVLEVYTNQPGVHFYTSNFFPEDPKTYKGDKSKLATLKGKEGDYYKHGALCFETQNWPDAANHENFPSPVLRPGEMYLHKVDYRFLVKK